MAETEAETSILDDVKAAMAENAGEAPAPTASETPTEAPAETAQQAADRVRDEQGRFAKAEEGKPRETLKLKEKPAAEVAGAAADKGTPPSIPPPAAATPAVQNGLDAPPLHWKGSQKVAWNKLPAEVRQGVLDDHKALQEERTAYEPLNRALEPFKEAFVREAGSLDAAISQLGQFHQASLTNPAGLALHILRARGIDPVQFAQQVLGQSQGTPAQAPQQPDINSLLRQAVQQELQPIKAQFEQAEHQQTLSVIQAFAADQKHPFFEDVKVHMGHLLRAGVAKDLQDAYDQATWANPVIRQHLTSAQAEEAKTASAAAAVKATQARAASLRGSPLPNGSAATGSGATVRDDVIAAMQELSGA